MAASAPQDIKMLLKSQTKSNRAILAHRKETNIKYHKNDTRDAFCLSKFHSHLTKRTETYKVLSKILNIIMHHFFKPLYEVLFHHYCTADIDRVF